MAVKLILREHVEHLGERGKIVSVAAGYARNYLLPKGLAYKATPGNLKMIEHQRRLWATRDVQETSAAEKLAARIGEIELSVSKKAGESGVLYGSVTKAEIAKLLAGQGIELDRRKIVADEAIKAVGSYEILIKLHHQVTAQLKLRVVPEEPEA